MRLIFSTAVLKALKGLPKKDAAALFEKLETVAADPLGKHPWASRLTNSPQYRVRHREWRAVYSIDIKTGVIIVDYIEHRREVYR
jgi:mRNA-degrading endonuclease RelE of RelBE toxin-antitoxin system